ncbi:hypothetical protein GGI00_004541, partial [Coemansia sp. RSA 2681]
MQESKAEGDIDIELEELRRVRRALGKMNQGIENVQHQMKYFNSNVSQTTQLLDIWVRILSQTAHNQAFLSNEEWQGGGMDSAKLGDLIQQDLQRQEEAERKIRDAEQKRDRERAEAKERERKRAELAAAAARDSRLLAPVLRMAAARRCLPASLQAASSQVPDLEQLLVREVDVGAAVEAQFHHQQLE